MKIRVELDLAEMFASEFTETRGSGYELETVSDSSFLDAIKDSIRREVVQKVLSEWRKEIGDSFGKEIRETVEKMQGGFLAATLQDLVNEKSIPGSRYGMEGEKISIIDVMRNRLTQWDLGSKTDDRLVRIAREQADKSHAELKARYDLLFASQLVTRMNESGMLREDVARLLLPPTAQGA